MSKIFLFLFAFLGMTTFAQQNNGLSKTIYKTMDENAENLHKNIKAYSVSIGIVKDGYRQDLVICQKEGFSISGISKKQFSLSVVFQIWVKAGWLRLNK